ncbi:MAG TPA: prepilin peptidase [Candidatus Paceibacterota bacterium]|nr:prepilin peptidase [Candidatus Paceibacterota bacterium]
MDTLIGLALFSLGAVLASFLAVVAERLYTGESWVKGRSRCNSCAEHLTGRDLVPVFSWIASGGRCRTCGSQVPISYMVGEATLGSVFLLGYLSLGFSLLLPLFLLIVSVLAFIVLYDLRHTVVPVFASRTLVVLSLLYAFLASPDLQALGLTLLTAGMVSLFFFLAYAISRGRAMGLGDAPVALALCLLVGGPFALPGFLFSFWIGGIVGIAILVSRPKGRRMGIEVPFVPFLAAGYLLAFFTQWNPLLMPIM